MKKAVRYGVSGILAVAMVAIAELAHEPEVIFPEIIALLIGGLVSPKQVWICGGPMLVFLMTLSALAGLGISACVPLPLFFQLVLGFLFIAVCLILTRTTLAPMISACILPILLHTTSWIYPLSVFAASSIIVLVRSLFERLEYSAPADRRLEGPLDLCGESLAWGKLLLVFAAVAVLPAFTGNPYFIAPPLLVTFVESSHFKPVMQKFWKKLIPFTFSAALLGVLSRLLLVQAFSLPSTLAALLVAGVLFLVIDKTALLFPPVGAIGFLPLILPATDLWLYPLEVTIGVCIFLLAAHFIFPVEKSKRLS